PTTRSAMVSASTDTGDAPGADLSWSAVDNGRVSPLAPTRRSRARSVAGIEEGSARASRAEPLGTRMEAHRWSSGAGGRTLPRTAGCGRRRVTQARGPGGRLTGV